MAGKTVQRRRGTTVEHSTFTGAAGEITVDLTKKVAVVHDGVTAGGFPLVRSGTLASTGITGAAASGANSDITSLTALTSINILPGYLFGCTMSTAGSSATMSIAAGRATDSTGLQSMALTAIAKTTSAWAVGTAAGGLDTGAIANSTWYHFYVIRRPDTGVTDVVFSTNATTPTLPANYTQFRRIGSGKTNGSAQWVGFTQTGDDFVLSATVLDYNVTNPGSGAAVSVTLASVPPGVKVDANILANTTDGANTNSGFLLSDLSANAETPAPVGNVSAWLSVAGQPAIFAGKIKTNTTAQIRAQLVTASATCTMLIRTRGWTDRRGRDA